MISFICTAILFDLDGVLVDSTKSVEREWRVWAKEHGIDGDAVMAIAHGVRSREVIKAVAPHLDAEMEALKLENREASDDGLVVMPGAIELVHSIPKDSWGVVTSGTRRLASARLRLAGVPDPKVLVAADDVSNGKPHPEPYLKGAERLGVKPEECVVIEDAPAGIQAAHAAGMKAIGLASTYPGAALTAADAVIQRLNQIRVAVEGERRLILKVD
ncbi:MAG: HAD family hydrolase [Candidatus Sulfotelmatobacter sp.]